MSETAGWHPLLRLPQLQMTIDDWQSLTAHPETAAHVGIVKYSVMMLKLFSS